jgi:hypothetical protein
VETHTGSVITWVNCSLLSRKENISKTGNRGNWKITVKYLCAIIMKDIKKTL